MKLIINADDFGLTYGVTQGIYDAIHHGVVTSTTMMVNTWAAAYAADLAREDPNLPVGLHINISLGNPITECPSLLRNGSFVKPAALGSDDIYDEAQLEREVNAQYERFVELVGRNPTHIDSHLYAHQKLGKGQRAIVALAERHKLPVRDADTSFWRAPHFEGNFKVLPGEDVPELKEKFNRLVKNLQDSRCTELMVHPGWADALLLKNSSYNIQRAYEYSVLTDPNSREYLQRLAVELVSFKECEKIDG